MGSEQKPNKSKLIDPKGGYQKMEKNVTKNIKSVSGGGKWGPLCVKKSQKKKSRDK